MKNVCLITGASGGLGKEFAYLFAKNGQNLVLVARSLDKLKALCKELQENYGIQAIPYQADLTVDTEILNLYEWTREQNLQIDYLVNNAGFGDREAFIGSNWKRSRSLLDLNVLALVHMTYLFGYDMKERRFGRILNIASAAAFAGGPYMALYYASKSFVLSFSEALYEELKGTGVSVTALCPGPTATEFEKNAHLNGSVMFSVLKPDSASKVAELGFKALMASKAIQYSGLVTPSFSMASRLLPRSISRKIAMRVNKNH